MGSEKIKIEDFNTLDGLNETEIDSSGVLDVENNEVFQDYDEAQEDIRPEEEEYVEERTTMKQEDNVKEKVVIINEDYKDKYLRAVAELENVKQRHQKQLKDQESLWAGKFLNKILPLLDDVFRATKLAQEEGVELSKITEGLNKINNKVNRQFQSLGLEITSQEGQVFDSDLHEAIATTEVATAEQNNTLVEIIENGYRYQDKIIRYAKVVIGEFTDNENNENNEK